MSVFYNLSKMWLVSINYDECIDISILRLHIEVLIKSNCLHWYRLDGKHCVFGKVLDDASMLVVRKCEAVPVSGSKGKPRLTLRIAESGEL